MLAEAERRAASRFGRGAGNVFDTLGIKTAGGLFRLGTGLHALLPRAPAVAGFRRNLLGQPAVKMRHSRSYDAIEGYADNIMRRAHRGVFAALAVYAVVFAYLCWRLA